MVFLHISHRGTEGMSGSNERSPKNLFAGCRKLIFIQNVISAWQAALGSDQGEEVAFVSVFSIRAQNTKRSLSWLYCTQKCEKLIDDTAENVAHRGEASARCLRQVTHGSLTTAVTIYGFEGYFGSYPQTIIPL